MKKKFSLIFMLTFLAFSLTQAQEATETKNKKGEISIAGDPGKGMFRMTFYLPKDAKKVVWTISDESGTVLVKEKYKKMSAGKQTVDYNYKNAPDGEHTFTIVADDTFTLTKKVSKKRG